MRMTFAPQSARCRPQVGPARATVNSITVKRDSGSGSGGGVGVSVSVMLKNLLPYRLLCKISDGMP